LCRLPIPNLTENCSVVSEMKHADGQVRCLQFASILWTFCKKRRITILGLILLASIVRDLTPRSRVHLQKLTVTQLVKKFSAFYETWRLITVFTRAHYSRLCITLGNKLFFSQRGFVRSSPNPKVGWSPLIGCLFNIFTAILRSPKKCLIVLTRTKATLTGALYARDVFKV
jgi:hypothetical protein